MTFPNDYIQLVNDDRNSFSEKNYMLILRPMREIFQLIPSCFLGRLLKDYSGNNLSYVEKSIK